MQLARGMGALVMMRDDPWEVPIPEKFEPSSYYKDNLENSQNELTKFKSMTREEFEEATRSWNFNLEESKRKAIIRNEETRLRLNNMISQVEAWQGAPEGIKEFALQQLNSTLGFDVLDDPIKYYDSPKNVDEYIEMITKALERDVEFYAKEYQKEIDRTTSRNEWLAQLRKSLKD